MVPVATARTGVEAGSRHRSLATPAMERLGAQWEGGAAYAFVSLFPIKILKVVFYDSVGLREARDFPTPSKFSGFLA